MLDRVTLTGQRRNVERVARTLAEHRQSIQLRHRRLITTVAMRLKRPESLALAFVSGMTLAMITPQRRRGEPAGEKRPMLNNLALRRVIALLRGHALTRLLAILSDPAEG